MKRSRRLLVALLVVAVVTAGAITIQRRVATHMDITAISASEFDALIKSLPQQRREFYSTPEGKKEFADQIQMALALAQEAKRIGLLGDPEVMSQIEMQKLSILASAYRDRHADAEITDEDIETFHRLNPTALQEVLKLYPQLGQSEDARDQVRRQLAELRIFADRAKKEGLDRDPGVALQLRIFPSFAIQQHVMRRLFENTTVSPEEIQRYYDQHRNEFGQVKARHILFSLRPKPDQQTPPDKEKVRQKALQVLQRLRAGEDFATLAREYSEDPGTKENGGDLGFFSRGRMVKEFEEAAFSLAPGQISDLVETTYGFHIIKVEEKRTAPLDNQTRLEIEQKVRAEKINKTLEDLKERYAVKIALTQ